MVMLKEIITLKSTIQLIKWSPVTGLVSVDM
jgi:hypothetical protein